jgi:hypothetical protein
LFPGCGGKPAWRNKNRMSSNVNLHRFAARLRGFMEASTLEQQAPAVTPEDAANEEEFNRMALELFGQQFEYNLPYRRICEARQIRPGAIADWRQIPAVPTSAFKELDLSCFEPEERTCVFISSGTTGTQPSRHFHNRDSLSLYEQTVLRWFPSTGLRQSALAEPSFPTTVPTTGGRLPREEAWGPLPRDQQQQEVSPGSKHAHWWEFFSLTPNKTAAPQSSLVHMFESIGRLERFTRCEFFGTIAGDGSWALDLGALQHGLEQVAAQAQPIMLVGTAFSFVHLLDHLVDQRLAFALPADSRVLETGGYKGWSRSLPKSELHWLIGGLLGVSGRNIICEYGMAELSSQAYDRLPVSALASQERGIGDENFYRRFCFPPWVRAEIISPETGSAVPEGQVGLIRVFDLANVYSVMAIQTEDLAVRRGAGFELIGRASQAEPRGCSLMAMAS